MNIIDCQNQNQDEIFEQIATELMGPGIVVLDNMFSSVSEGIRLSEQLLSQAQSDLVDFDRAGIGRAGDHQLNESIRGDSVQWLDETKPASQMYLQQMAKLQAYLNRRLYLGLFSYEAHFAYYPVGQFYKKHLDAFRGQANRMLTSVYYLNENWQSEFGGEIEVFSDQDHEQSLVKLEPKADRLVLFLSEEFPHQVLPATQERFSIAGWFRLNSSTSGKVDPQS